MRHPLLTPSRKAKVNKITKNNKTTASPLSVCATSIKKQTRTN